MVYHARTQIDEYIFTIFSDGASVSGDFGSPGTSQRDPDERLLPSWEGSVVGRFLESLHDFLAAHRDHEPDLHKSLNDE